MDNSTPYYLFFDFDGTIFIDKTIAKETQDAINLAKSHGCKVYVNTGRSLPNLFKDLKKSCDIVFDGYLCGASSIYLGNNAETCLQEKYIPLEDAIEIINYIRDKSFWANIETDKGVHTVEMHGHITYTNEERQAFADKAIDFVKSANKIFKFGIFPPVTTNYHSEDIHDALPKYEWCFLLRGYELIHKGYGKGKTLKQFANLTGFDENKFIMFGDSENDLQAFKMAGRKVAMEHSPKELKDLATYVAKTNLGVAEYINSLFLDK